MHTALASADRPAHPLHLGRCHVAVHCHPATSIGKGGRKTGARRATSPGPSGGQQACKASPVD
eukprot:7900805-Prorocentrum_lima.AAC.1